MVSLEKNITSDSFSLFYESEEHSIIENLLGLIAGPIVNYMFSMHV